MQAKAEVTKNVDTIDTIRSHLIAVISGERTHCAIVLARARYAGPRRIRVAVRGREGDFQVSLRLLAIAGVCGDSLATLLTIVRGVQRRNSAAL